jgi:hypothetical protein
MRRPQHSLAALLHIRPDKAVNLDISVGSTTYTRLKKKSAKIVDRYVDRAGRSDTDPASSFQIAVDCYHTHVKSDVLVMGLFCTSESA